MLRNYAQYMRPLELLQEVLGLQILERIKNYGVTTGGESNRPQHDHHGRYAWGSGSFLALGGSLHITTVYEANLLYQLLYCFNRLQTYKQTDGQKEDELVYMACTAQSSMHNNDPSNNPSNTNTCQRCMGAGIKDQKKTVLKISQTTSNHGTAAKADIRQSVVQTVINYQLIIHFNQVKSFVMPVVNSTFLFTRTYYQYVCGPIIPLYQIHNALTQSSACVRKYNITNWKTKHTAPNKWKQILTRDTTGSIITKTTVNPNKMK